MNTFLAPSVALQGYHSCGSADQSRKKQEPNFGEVEPGVMDRAREALRNLRFLRLLIVLWNVVVIFLMFVFFS